MLRRTLAVGVFSVLFLEMTAVFEDQFCRVLVAAVEKMRPLKPSLTSLGRARSVAMDMSQNDGIDAGGLIGSPVQFARLRPPVPD